jgi:hypothetical protein
LRGALRHGNLDDAEHTPTNRRCYGGEIAWRHAVAATLATLLLSIPAIASRRVHAASNVRYFVP